jgi:integrase
LSRKTYKKKIKNGYEYYTYRLRHPNLEKPLDLQAKTVKELEEKINNRKKELDNGIINNKQSFGVFFTEWLFNVNFIKCKPSTKERYEGIYRNYIKNSSIYNNKIKDLKPIDIQRYYNNLINEGRSVGVVKSIHKLIGPCIRYAYDSNIIIKDFAKAIKLPTESEKIKLNKKNEVNPFTKEEQRKFENSIKGNELETLFITALDTGLRQGEILALTWDDIDFNNNIMVINKSIKSVATVNQDGRGKSEIIEQTPKSQHGIRKVKITKRLIILLKKHKKRQLENTIKLDMEYNKKNLVFCNAYGNYLDASNIRKKFNKIFELNNIRKIKFHDLRHTFATRLFEEGENPKIVQTMLGHSNLAMTFDTYTHVSDCLKVKATNKLDLLHESDEYKNLLVI